MQNYLKLWEFENIFKNYDNNIDIAKSMESEQYELPFVLVNIKKYLENQDIILSENNLDGRTNSCAHEDIIKEIIKEYLPNGKYWIPPHRHWFDILVYDEVYGWIPINIKSSTLQSSDNVGNLSLCVQAYTDHKMDYKKSYNNGELVDILADKFKNNKFNENNRKDYFFLVINKNNTNEIIINSVLGLKTLTANIHNLPFQVKWKNNKQYDFKDMGTSIEKYKYILKIYKNKDTWKESHKNLYDLFVE